MPMARRLALTLLLLLVAAAFGIPGGWLLGQAWPSFRDSYASGDWVKVRAEVLDVVETPSKWLFLPETSLQARYRYTFAGKEYTGTRLQWRDPLDATGDGDWKRDMHEFLSSAKAEGRPVSVYVNPDSPGQAVVDRSLAHRWMSLAAPVAMFGVAVAGAFLWLVVELWKAMPGATAGRREQVATEKGGLAALWLFASLWNGFMLPVAIFVVPGLVDEGEWAGLAVLSVFALIGVLLLLGVIMGTWRRLLGMVRSSG
jgi:hypothetical protein